VRECVRDFDNIVRTAATRHGWTISGSPTDFQLVVDADIDRAKITTTEYSQCGASQQEGYTLVYTVSVKLGFLTKANCRRGDKFVQLDVYPCCAWNAYYGAMGDLVDFASAYAKAFRQAVSGAFDGIAKITDADDTDDEGTWNAGLWSPSQNRQMYNNFVSPVKDESAASKRAFYGVSKLAFAGIDLLEDAAREFDEQSIRQKWADELNRSGQEIDSSSDVRLSQEVTMYKLVNDWGFAKSTVAYVNMSVVRASQENVVFRLNGELRRAGVWLWDDVNTAAALPRNKSDTARDLVNQSIRSAVREFDLRR
jgi:hypothetical protein